MLPKTFSGVGGDREAARQHRVDHDTAGAAALLVPAAAAAAAEGVDEPTVPARTAGERRRCRSRGVVQGRHLVDAPVDGADLHADDVGHRPVVERGRRGQVGRAGPCRQGLERRRAGGVGGAVEVLDAGRDGAVGVERLADRSARGRAVLGRLAGERLLARSAEQGAGRRTRADGERRRPGPRRRRGEPVVSRREALDEPEQVARDDAEAARHVGAVALHPHRARSDARRHVDADQGVAAGHRVRPAGDGGQAQRRTRRGARRGRQHEQGEQGGGGDAARDEQPGERTHSRLRSRWEVASGPRVTSLHKG